MEEIIKGICERTLEGGFPVWIGSRLLNPARSQKIRNHSPDGFNWGYGGSGPAQLALALLLEFTDKETAQELYQQFKWDIIAKLDKNFTLPVSEVKNWIDKHTKKDEVITA